MKPKMNDAWRRLLLTALGCFLVSCGGLDKSNSEAAIRKAIKEHLAGPAGSGEAEAANAAIQKTIEEHLAGRPGLAEDQIVVEMKQVQVQGGRAEADVMFHSRSDPQAKMAFHYQLRSEGKQWKVESGRPSAETSPHPPSSPSESAPPLPEGHPPLQP